MKLTLIVLLAATCLDSFVVMMERGSSMREMKRTKGGCHALIFALVNTVMLFVGMQLSGVIASHNMMEVDRLLSALILSLIHICWICHRTGAQCARLSARSGRSADPVPSFLKRLPKILLSSAFFDRADTVVKAMLHRCASLLE